MVIENDSTSRKGAGEFGQKRFLCQLEELIENWSYDVLSLRLEVRTVNGAKLKALSYLTFEVISEQQEDVGSFLVEVKKLVHDARVVLVGE